MFFHYRWEGQYVGLGQTAYIAGGWQRRKAAKHSSKRVAWADQVPSPSHTFTISKGAVNPRLLGDLRGLK